MQSLYPIDIIDFYIITTYSGLPKIEPMEILRKILSKFLSHPAWTGVGSLVAVVALIVALYPQDNSISPDKSLRQDKLHLLKKERQQPTRKYVSQRIALLIGISDYEGQFKLKNPVKDIDEIADVLKSKGFKIIRKRNATLKEIEKAISDFQTMLSMGGVGLFFYSGHGLRVGGDDYLIPKDAAQKIENEEDIKIYAINFSRLLRPVDKILEESPKNNGSVVVYAAGSGSVAMDGEDHSPFASSFLEGIKNENYEVFDLFRFMNKSVSAETSGKQIPWISASVDTEFYINKPERDEDIGVMKLLFFDSCRNNPFSHFR